MSRLRSWTPDPLRGSAGNTSRSRGALRPGGGGGGWRRRSSNRRRDPPASPHCGGDGSRRRSPTHRTLTNLSDSRRSSSHALESLPKRSPYRPSYIFSTGSSARSCRTSDPLGAYDAFGLLAALSFDMSLSHRLSERYHRSPRAARTSRRRSARTHLSSSSRWPRTARRRRW